MKYVSTVKELENWIESAKPGESVVYHTGLLAADRETVDGNGRIVYRAPNGRALTAWAEYANGRGELTQRRLDDGVCQYILTKRKWKRRHY